ncbi:4-hydroxybenzoate polyprenyltransferase [Rhodospirillaceae bacterium LM-1]|nr:4-hydroxybenzoate polyprenyltransferase [Rhodospirillaceae bacterium LM-1]
MSAMERTLAGDIPMGNWVDRRLPSGLRPYARLMRLDRPIGTWLLLLPGWWGVALAADGWPDLKLIILFGLGAMVMRGAGCTFNDWADRDFDGLVERTRTRPIPSGAVTPNQALMFLVLELAVGLVILLQFNLFAILVGAASLLLVFPYPYMKRITYWPQAWLGLTFNWGALLGFAAASGLLAWPALILYAAGLFWTLGYDTIYAHQDKEDDALIGVKSTALRLGVNTKPWLLFFFALAVALIGFAGWLAQLAWPFYLFLGAAWLQTLWQVSDLESDDSADCLSKFKSNRYFGWLVLAGIVAGKVLA